MARLLVGLCRYKTSPYNLKHSLVWWAYLDNNSNNNNNPGVIRTLCNPCIYSNLAMLTIWEYSEPFYNCIQTNTQDPVIFRKIGKRSGNSKAWHIPNPDIFQIYFTFMFNPDTYSEHC